MRNLRKNWKAVLFVDLLLVTFITETYYSGSLSYYFTHSLGMPIRYQSVAWGIFVVVSIIAGIVLGIVEDRFVGHRDGRRIPFIRLFGPGLGLVFALAYNLFQGGQSNAVLFVSYVVILVALFTFESVVSDSLLAIPSEEISDEKSRNSVYIGLGIAAGIGLALYLLISQLQNGDEAAFKTFRTLIIIIGVLSAVILFGSSFVLPHTFIQSSEAVTNTRAVKSFLECFKNKTFMVGEIYLTAVVCTTSVCLLGLYYYFDEVAEIKLYAYLGFVIGILGTWIFYNKCVGKISKRLLYGIPTLAMIFCFLVTSLLKQSTLGPLFALTGGGIGAFVQYTFNNMIIVEAVDADEEKSGIRKEAQYKELDYLFDTLGSLCQSVYLLIILAFGYVEGLPVGGQSLQVQNGILLATFVFPALILAVGTIAMLFVYPEKKEL